MGSSQEEVLAHKLGRQEGVSECVGQCVHRQCVHRQCVHRHNHSLDTIIMYIG